MDDIEYKEDLLKIPVEKVYNKYIIGGDVWYFKDKYGENWFDIYDQFKIFISKKLEVHYNDIAIAGSAKLGFSLNPTKNFRLFNEESDIDIIVISRKYFYLFWDSYRRDSYAEVRTPNFNKVCFGIFRKYIIFDGFKKNNLDYLKWLKKTQGFEKNLQLEFEIENSIHYRIFESWDAAKDYYIASIVKSKKIIQGELT